MSASLTPLGRACDFSFMTHVAVSGPQAPARAQRMITNDAALSFYGPERQRSRVPPAARGATVA